MLERTAVVFGAGRIARGFVGHLLGMDGYHVTFVDVDPGLVKELDEAKCYTVHIMGAPEKSSVVQNVSALLPDSPALKERLSHAEIVFVSVGGANLPSVAESLADGLLPRLDQQGTPLNIIVCENWQAAGRTLRDALATRWAAMGREFPSGRIGVVESTIMRSAVDATPDQLAQDPLAKQSQDYWSLPIDADALVTELRGPAHIEPVRGFANALKRKLFIYNGGNATISYLGILKGYEFLGDAANDPEIEAVARSFHAETSDALTRSLGFEASEQAEFAARALTKFQNRSIVDPLSRQVRDPLRKLSHGDRLVGAALFTLEAGIVPNSAALAIRAALEYRNAADPSAAELAARIENRGLAETLAEVGGIPLEHPLVELVMAKTPMLADLTTTRTDIS